MKRNLKLFVWTETNESYAGGCFWAIAETEEEARSILASQVGFAVYFEDFGPDVFPVNEKACGGGYHAE